MIRSVSNCSAESWQTDSRSIAWACSTAATAIASLAVVAAYCRWRTRTVRSASRHLSHQPLPRRAVGILKAKMAKWSLWHLG